MGLQDATPSSADFFGNESKDLVYERLFATFWPRVRQYFDCYVDDRDEVDELAAEVFVVAWRKLDPHRPMTLAWFLRTANNKLRDRGRRARSRERALASLAHALAQSSSTLEPLDALAIRTAVRMLSARERQVVVLTYWEGLTAWEVACVLRTTQTAVWTTLTRARAKLRASWTGSHP